MLDRGYAAQPTFEPDLDALAPQVRRIARAVARPDEDLANEVAQRSLIKIWKAKEKDALPDPLLPGWIWTVVRNAMRDILDKRAALRENQEDESGVASREAEATIDFSHPVLTEELVRLALDAAEDRVHLAVCYLAWFLLNWKPDRIVREFAGESNPGIVRKLEREFAAATATPAGSRILLPLTRALQAAPASHDFMAALAGYRSADVREAVSEWKRQMDGRLQTQIRLQERDGLAVVLSFGRPHEPMAFLWIHALGRRPAEAAAFLDRTYGDAAASLRGAYLREAAVRLRHGDGIQSWFDPLDRRISDWKLRDRSVPFEEAKGKAVQAGEWSAGVLSKARQALSDGKLPVLFAHRAGLMAKWGVQ
ncbi:MAG: hypothetical protein U0Q16_25835 [Bryobacteraceae bacterium]